MASNLDLTPKEILQITLRLAATFTAQLVLLLSLAWELNWPEAFLFVTLTTLGQLTVFTYLAAKKPGLLRRRKENVRKGQVYDQAILGIYMILLFITHVLAGLGRRWGWLPLHSPFWSIGGAAAVLFGYIILIKAMAANDFFESSARIQNELKHHVCQKGPYRVIRHPGYLAVILIISGSAAIIKVGAVFFSAGAIVLLYIVRTALEDKMLQKQLKDYPEYSQKTRYRLIPGIW